MTPPPPSSWYCVRTQTKRETTAANILRELEGVEVFNPRLRYRKATRRGKIWWGESMFPGYLLAKFNLEELERAVKYSQGVRGLVHFGNKFPTVPAAFIDALREEIRKHKTADEETIVLTPQLLVGDEVEIASGPFRGMQGRIVEVAPASERVKVLLDFLGQKQPVNLDLFSILLPRRPTPT